MINLKCFYIAEEKYVSSAEFQKKADSALYAYTACVWDGLCGLSVYPDAKEEHTKGSRVFHSIFRLSLSTNHLVESKSVGCVCVWVCARAHTHAYICVCVN